MIHHFSVHLYQNVALYWDLTLSAQISSPLSTGEQSPNTKTLLPILPLLVIHSMIVSYNVADILQLSLFLLFHLLSPLLVVHQVAVPPVHEFLFLYPLVVVHLPQEFLFLYLRSTVRPESTLHYLSLVVRQVVRRVVRQVVRQVVLRALRQTVSFLAHVTLHCLLLQVAPLTVQLPVFSFPALHLTEYQHQTLKSPNSILPLLLNTMFQLLHIRLLRLPTLQFNA